MWGLKLGTVVSNLRNAASTLPPQKRDALNELGFVWRLVERGVGPSPPASISLDKQTQILQVVECQRAQQPHTKFVNLPSRFKVPSTASWPRHLHKCVVDISTFRRAYNEGRLQPSIVQALDAIHFVWNDQNHQWNLKLEALAIYRATYHDVLVGQDFVIPPDDSTWPVYLWGKKLGAAVLDFRLSQQHLSQAQRDELDAIGFVWDAIEDQWQVNYAGLATYKSIYGHLQVPQAFVVPDNDPKWPPKLWNTRLASVVHHLRHCNLANERRDALDALGFVWNPLEVQWNRNLRALAWFKTMHGHVRIPRKFVVPDQSPTWPQDLWNMKLGMTAFNLRIRSRQDGYPANRLDQLSQLGLIEPN
ncbi:hypothetical protein DYB32_007597 [Aphanomyces invadans]|uniref:Helicase-associated domain-containing protein n=1 Tax=Aphanomyces invadans TaxID=157072 RepID=A0A418AN41_9STRA|nr:hypothetical protein DYB32_007597 [Aphanomyces invadans]